MAQVVFLKSLQRVAMGCTETSQSNLDDIIDAFRVLPFHEAGHAVAAWSVGLRVEEVSIEPKRHSLGRCRHRAAGADYLSKRIVVSLAGEGAAAKIAPGRGHLGTGRDRRVTCRCALVLTNRNKVAARLLIEEKGIEVRALVDRHWDAIRDVAFELDRRRHLTARQTANIIRQPLLKFSQDIPRPSIRSSGLPRRLRRS